MKLLSFVIPCYRSEKTIAMVIEEIITTVHERSEYDYEIICVNDASPDNVYDVLLSLAKHNKRIKLINFAKNMGKHAAVLAGYAHVNGDYIINIDDDYQSPTYELWRLLEPVEKEGYDISTADYREKKESWWKKLGSEFDRKLQEVMVHQPADCRINNFFILQRYIVDEMVKYKNPYPYISGLIMRITHNIKNVSMNERDRADDNSTGFTMRKSISLFLNGFTAFSVVPLRIATISGFFFALMGLVYGLYIIIRKILMPEIPVGYSSLAAMIMFSSGMIMLMLGMIGEYIGRIYICINEYPQYVVKDTVNIL